MKQSDLYLLAGLPELSDEEKHRLTLAGLADVDAGRTIPHDAVRSWARSLVNPNSGSTNEE